MDQINVKLGEELANQVLEAMREFGYHTKASFVREAIRNEFKELRNEREKNYVWHKLLSAHKKIRGVKRTWTAKEKPYKSRLTLKDLLKYQYNPEQTRLT